MLFARTGLSTAEISSLFAIWSITGLVVEVPSGAWADVVSRRLLLGLAPCLGAIGFGLWTVAPSYPAFAAGFVLWGMQGALQSGALEALVYEELDRVGAAPRFAEVVGRATAGGTVASAAAIGLAAPVQSAGGFTAVGAASVLACLAAAAVGLRFPEHRTPARGRERAAVPGGEDDDARPLTAVLREGLRLVRADRRVRAAVLLVPAVWALWGSLDEYAPLLALEAGASAEAVPLLFLVVYAGVAAGGLLGGVAGRLDARGLAAALALAAGALAAGALAGIPWGFALLGVAFCGFQAVSIVAEARLQEAITGPARATVTSVAGLATEGASVIVFAVYAAGSAGLDHATLFVLAAAVYVPIAAAIARR